MKRGLHNASQQRRRQRNTRPATLQPAGYLNQRLKKWILLHKKGKSNRKLLEHQLLLYQKQLAQMEKSQKIIRSLRHDMKYHIIFLRSCLMKEDIPNALRYLDEIEKCIETSENFIHSGNYAVDSILNYYLSRAKQLNSKYTTKIMVPPDLKISDFDLNIILGNLLENALDALQRVEKRTLDIYIRYEINILYISIYNSYDGVYQKRNNDYISIKNDTKNHGYGLENIRAVLDKYNGISRFTADESTFKADIILNT